MNPGKPEATDKDMSEKWNISIFLNSRKSLVIVFFDKILMFEYTLYKHLFVILLCNEQTASRAY